jgi:hypothetical protein
VCLHGAAAEKAPIRTVVSGLLLNHRQFLVGPKAPLSLGGLFG